MKTEIISIIMLLYAIGFFSVMSIAFYYWRKSRNLKKENTDLRNENDSFNKLSTRQQYNVEMNTAYLRKFEARERIDMNELSRRILGPPTIEAQEDFIKQRLKQHIINSPDFDKLFDFERISPASQIPEFIVRLYMYDKVQKDIDNNKR